MQIFPVVSSVEVWWDQLSVTSLSTSLCSNHHFSKWNLLCWTWFSLNSRQIGTWSEVILSWDLRSSRENLVCQPSQIRTLSSLVWFGFSLISDQMNLQLLSGRSMSLNWTVTLLKVSLSWGWRSIRLLSWENLVMLKSPYDPRWTPSTRYTPNFISQKWTWLSIIGTINSLTVCTQLSTSLFILTDRENSHFHVSIRSNLSVSSFL